MAAAMSSTIDALERALAGLIPYPTPEMTSKVEVKQISADVVMDATVNDCHHNGASEWGVLRNELYTRHKTYPLPAWIKVKRISFTAKRISLLARLLRRGRRQ
jgi:hypothetical protein